MMLLTFLLKANNFRWYQITGKLLAKDYVV
jgi:hypothetical protein